MPLPIAGAILGSAGIGAVASIFSGGQQRRASQAAVEAQLQGTRESIAAQREAADRAFGIFTEQSQAARDQLQPLVDLGVRNIQRAEDFLDPNSELSQQERSVFQRNLANTLSARGLTASGTELAGLAEFDVGLGGQRRNLALNLASLGSGAIQQGAGITQGVGQAGMNIFSNLGQGTAQAFQAGGAAQAQGALQQGQINAQTIAGLNNAFQTAAGGLIGLNQQQQAAATTQARFDQLFGSLSRGPSQDQIISSKNRSLADSGGLFIG